jgi:hypothetical protein
MGINTEMVMISLQDCCLKHEQCAGGAAQVLERLPSNCEALSSNPSTVQKKKKYE